VVRPRLVRNWQIDYCFDFIDLDDFIEELYEVNIDEMLKNGHEDLFRS